MKIENTIRKKLEDKFQPTYLELENESHKHHVPPGSESHFRLLLVSDFFKGKSRVERARIVHSLLAEELSGGVHALSERFFSSEEWSNLNDQQKLMISPNCLNRRD